MSESNSTAVQRVAHSDERVVTMPETTDTYIRQQLETRRTRLNTAIASAPASQMARFEELLSEVDSALQRMDAGTYGICDVCNDTIERDRLIEDPLVRVCLDHLNAEQRRALEGDLELAAGVQRSLLPPTHVQSLGWQIEYEYKPAGLVSGDYCDVILPADSDDGLVFLIGDVSGKGVAASLLMSYLRATFRSLAGARMDVHKLLEAANRLFGESTMAGQFATLVCGRAGRDGSIQIANAGHCPALAVSQHGVKRIDATGLPLGMFTSGHYSMERVDLEPGDSLLLFTDGISEARDGRGNEYGIEGISKWTQGKRAQESARFVTDCLNEVQLFSSGVPQADDQTLMLIRRAESRRSAQIA